jgi:hypothetical protein
MWSQYRPTWTKMYQYICILDKHSACMKCRIQRASRQGILIMNSEVFGPSSSLAAHVPEPGLPGHLFCLQHKRMLHDTVRITQWNKRIIVTNSQWDKQIIGTTHNRTLFSWLVLTMEHTHDGGYTHSGTYTSWLLLTVKYSWTSWLALSVELPYHSCYSQWGVRIMVPENIPQRNVQIMDIPCKRTNTSTAASIVRWDTRNMADKKAHASWLLQCSRITGHFRK